ncbi:MAG: polyprenyl synthetase family protein [Clostridiales bacterium]|nr:polyprenyl synthetase family protein [Clostridiales bacterium]
MTKYTDKIEKALNSYIPEYDCLEKAVVSSMKYSLLAGGKRIRPLLAVMFCELNGGKTEAAVPFGCAVEMIHTYSLIHDDLPCMDDDDMRRGKPSNHIAYGEANALLAGDALQSLAFEIMTNEQTRELCGDTACVEAINVLASRIGAHGMVGGQVIDLENENKRASADVLRIMDDKKTGDLIAAACELGCIAANAGKKERETAVKYAKALGAAFQIQDDILDVTASQQELGKPINSDSDKNKSTYVALYGIERCREIVNELTQEAVSYISGDSDAADELRKLACSLAKRNK